MPRADRVQAEAAKRDLGDIRATAARYDAACDLIRAGDDMRLLAGLGRITHADTDRLRDADERWTHVR